MPGLPLLKFVAVAMLILANAFFVAAEFALVYIRDSRIEQMVAVHVSGSRAVRRLRQDMDDFLPAVQLGVTLCSLAIGWLAEPLVTSIFLHWFSIFSIPAQYVALYANIAGWASIILGFVLITYLHVLVGELVPKSLALRRVEALAVAVAPPMLVFMALARPAVRFLRISAAAVLRGFDIPFADTAQAHSPDELKLIASAARRKGSLPQYQETLIHRALELNEVLIREIMLPRQKIFSLPADMSLDEAGVLVIDHQHSRIPVYDPARGPEHIVGVLYSKDVARIMYIRLQKQYDAKPGSAYDHRPFVDVPLAQVMRNVLVVPETKTVLDLLREFQQRRRHLAIVVDEFGSTVGLVTAEDAIEQLTGELEDEFDFPDHPVLTTSGGIMLMDGGVNLRDLETQMQWNLPRDGSVETLAGFLLMQLGHIPDEGESIHWGGRKFTVMEMDGLRIARVRVEKMAEETTIIER